MYENDKNIANEQYALFTEEQHNIWSILYDRQVKSLQGLAHPYFFEMLEQVGISADKIPNINDINPILQRMTNFQLYFQDKVTAEDDFFLNMSEGKFPTTFYLRSADQLDYALRPDIFHDIFAHVPFLAVEKPAQIAKLCGKIGVDCYQNNISTKFITKLYLYIMEFGLVKSGDDFLILGAGIISSKDESLFAAKSKDAVRLKFNPYRMMRTNYNYTKMQNLYFVIESFEEVIEFLSSFDIEMLKDQYFEKDLNSDVLLDEDIRM